jgi:hypothetical protein
VIWNLFQTERREESGVSNDIKRRYMILIFHLLLTKCLNEADLDRSVKYHA